MQILFILGAMKDEVCKWKYFVCFNIYVLYRNFAGSQKGPYCASVLDKRKFTYKIKAFTKKEWYASCYSSAKLSIRKYI